MPALSKWNPPTKWAMEDSSPGPSEIRANTSVREGLANRWLSRNGALTISSGLVIVVAKVPFGLNAPFFDALQPVDSRKYPCHGPLLGRGAANR